MSAALRPQATIREMTPADLPGVGAVDGFVAGVSNGAPDGAVVTLQY